MAKGNDAFGPLLRSKTAAGGDAGVAADGAGSSAITEFADEYLDGVIEGLGGLHAALDLLSNEDASAPDNMLPHEASVAFTEATNALENLRTELDDALMSLGYEPTTV